MTAPKDNPGGGMTLAEAIIASHTADSVAPGAVCRTRVDFAFANDITGPPAIEEFRRMGAVRVFDPERCAIIPDHFTPNKDIASAEGAKRAREFAREQGMKYWEVGRVGVEHAFIPETGNALPGEIIIGADSHTCTYGALGALGTGMGQTDLAAVWALGETWLRVPETLRVILRGAPSRWVGGKDLIIHLIGVIGVEGARYMSIEFHGDAAASLPQDDRFTMSNMAIEAGAKCGLFVPDETTMTYASARGTRDFTPVYPGEGARYARTVEIDASSVEPTVALPHLPGNARRARDCAHLEIDQVFIGSCTNGRSRDIEIAADMLAGRTVHERVRLIVIPASYEVYNEALERGWLRIFSEAGAAVCTPTCGPCMGGHLGILAAGERAVSTSNRNFVGRMGHKESEIILASPAVAAASAILGRVADPREVSGDTRPS
ncbi:MAG: 3-isopropylmalate dehydratase large subunit [Synergistaceae bacterium]|jgi:3-isopropylmalate/(R)-2-methylmalate dehydratase large subunit|nr:3-isopropylmalate dehydratase large subunit [Synergistaceae bacterium]